MNGGRYDDDGLSDAFKTDSTKTEFTINGQHFARSKENAGPIADKFKEAIANPRHRKAISTVLNRSLRAIIANTQTNDEGEYAITVGFENGGTKRFLPKYQEVPGRKSIDEDKIKEALQAVSFDTVSMDFIFSLPGQSFEDLRSDIDKAFEVGANHVAIYPFIDFTFTSSPVKAMPKKMKSDLMDRITLYCYEKGLYRSSIWTFSSKEEAKYSSMTRENFLGFGCSATTLLKDQFKINTFDVDEYCRRIDERKLPTSLTIRFTKRQRMVYYLFWTAYSTRVDIDEFEKFFGEPLKKKYGFEILIGKLFGLITEKDGILSLTLKGAFYYHYYENFYTLSYIDRMWGIMRKEAFPKKIKL